MLVAGLVTASALPGCAAPTQGATTFSLEDTHWVMVSLRGNPVAAGAAPGAGRAPDLMLLSSGRRVTAYGGCNRLMGTYRHDGAALGFGPMTGTRMACPATMELESTYVATLQAVARWRVSGDRLQLLDTQQAVIAEFEAGAVR